jgi:hypothetical protein
MQEFTGGDRVRLNTLDDVNRRIDRRIEESVRYYSARPRAEVACRINDLALEWDIERVLQLMASSLSLSGLILGMVRSRVFFLVPTAVLSFLLLHAVQGWCPPIPVLRRLGVRTREEIERERYALKALLGDFGDLSRESDRAGRALAGAVSAT